MDEDQKETQPEPVPQENPAAPAAFNKPQGPKVLDATPRKKSRFPVALVIIVVVLIIGGGVYFFLRSRSNTGPEASPTPFVRGLTSPTTLPAETTAPEVVDRGEVSISVLNGSGIAGEAAYLQGKLADLGYTEIDTGNASNQDNETTRVTFSTDLSEATIDEITEELESIYKKVSADTSSSQEVGVEVITGLRKGQTPIPEASATPEATDEGSPTASPTESPTPTPTTST